MKIAMIGAGAVAWHMAHALDKCGFEIVHVYSRTLTNAQELVKKLTNAQATTNLDFSSSPARLFILSITDDAYQSVLDKLKLPSNAMLVHTSGSLPMCLLASVSKQIGVFYPLQTFSKQKNMDFKGLPICIEASDSQLEDQLTNIAKKLNCKIHIISSEQRAYLHVAAVFACNFTNHCMSLAESITTRHALSLDMLKPLIRETFEKALSNSPKDVQTGPAIRKDHKIIEKHRAYLENNTAYTELYLCLTKSIIDFYKS